GVGFLLKKNNVEHIKGTGILRGQNTIEVVETGANISADNIIIATGARQRPLPNLPIDGSTVITSREALELREVPQKVIIVGGGATGAEFAHIYRTYGAAVTIVELLPRLIPQEDEELSQHLERAFKRQGIEVMTGASVSGIFVNGNKAEVTVSTGSSQTVLEGDKVLVAVGVQGNTDGIGLESVGVETDRSFIVIDDHMKTNIPGVYAIGDVTGKMLLAHVASAQGVTAVETIAGLKPPQLDYDTMPRAIYCKPQVASFGLTEAQARDKGFNIKIGRFPFSASGKALALGETDGLVKLVIDAEVGEILGAHMIGAEVTELLGELSMTKLLEGTTTELGWLVHPHPTISETLKEAALAADGRAIHA
ncbi:MAG: dihydrolipoyl dehydrogenase, partial [Chloroflexi bacterium]|nr:dihydrolipoyl dehydrogenase [Chloroflexota bacterium]